MCAPKNGRTRRQSPLRVGCVLSVVKNLSKFLEQMFFTFSRFWVIIQNGCSVFGVGWLGLAFGTSRRRPLQRGIYIFVAFWVGCGILI